MLDFYIQKYAAIQNINPLLSKVKYYGLKRRICCTIANAKLPDYFNKTPEKRTFKPNNSSCDNIVSLTTFPARINKINLVIECMMRQTTPPDKIILWLSKKQFSSLEKLPKQLLELKNHGLTIEFAEEDIRSHKKYFYTLKQFPKANIITVDDDYFYPTTLLEQLLEEHKLYPKDVICHRAHEIKVENQKLQSYSKWRYEFQEESNTNTVFFTSGGGTLFPSESLHPEVLNKEVFLEKCRLADDIWLNAMTRLQVSKIQKIESKFAVNLPIQYSNSISLADQNVGNNQNDVQLNAVREHYKKALNKDIFADLEL